MSNMCATAACTCSVIPLPASMRICPRSSGQFRLRPCFSIPVLIPHCWQGLPCSPSWRWSFGCSSPNLKIQAPKTSTELRGHSQTSGLWSCLREKKFIGFAAFYSVNLVAANQLYFALPRPLASAGGLAVVIGNTALAPRYELAYTPSITTPAPWLLLSLLGAITATFIAASSQNRPSMQLVDENS